MATKKSTELATQATNAFAALADFDMGEAMAEELDGLDLSFDRIKIPSGGGLFFEMPSDDPDAPEPVREFNGVILFHHTLHAYYKSKYTGGNQPPDCGSFDGITGEGDPGGRCDACPLNQFGTGENGAKACKHRRRVYLLREGEIFPILLSLPTGSLKELTRYLKRLLSQGLKSNMVLTRFSLCKAVNKGGIEYSQAQFAVDRPLTPDERKIIYGLTEQVKAYSRRVGFDVDDTVEQDAAPMVDPDTGEIIEPLT